jgi:iron only hydrogenase large subunit-like protein
MNNITPETEELLNLLDRKSKMVAMLAPSFIVDFKYPEIIGMLKHLGFEYVVEVSRGAMETNNQLLSLLELHPDNRYIASPCPVIVRMVRNKYPDLVPFLTQIDSPMSATARIVSRQYPGYKKVFIGPCFVKKIEAKEDYPELDILVLTFKEIKKIFEIKNIFPKESEKSYSFDIVGPKTRLYPISGGLAQSSGLSEKFTASECYVVSGPKLAEEALRKFPAQVNIKVLDILYCDGGCINGSGIDTKDSLDIRRQKVVSYWRSSKE